MQNPADRIIDHEHGMGSEKRGGRFMANADYHRTLAQITPEVVQQTLLDLIDISSPTGYESAIAQYIQ
jgi:hypothetical protein